MKDLRVVENRVFKGLLRYLNKKNLFFDIIDKRWLDYIDNYLKNRNINRVK